MADKYFQMTQRNTANTDWDNLYPEGKFETAGGTATVITLTVPNLVDGISKTFIASASNNGAATTINGKPLYKPNTTIAPNLVAGKACTVWYNAANSCFFIKASAEGTAVAANVLAGTTFSNDNDIGISGGMTNHGAVTITPGTSDQTISEGYISSATVKGESNLIPPNIKEGVSEYGVVGTLEEKQDFSDYLFNLPTNYLPISYIEGEGLYCANITSFDKKCYLFDSQGNLTKTITNTGYGSLPTHVTKNYIVWSAQTYANVTDKTGNLINASINISNNNVSCINSNTQKIYTAIAQSGQGQVVIHNFSGTILKTISLAGIDTMTYIYCIVPIKNGVLLFAKDSASYPFLCLITDDGIFKNFSTINGALQVQLFSSVFKLL